MAKNGLGEMTIIPPRMHQEARALIHKDKVKQLKAYGKMKPTEQQELVEETRNLGAAFLAHGSSGLAIGQHLTNVQKLLTPYNAFYKFLATFHLSQKTAYRYLNGFTNAEKAFPESVLKAAMARGLKIYSDDKTRPLGNYTEAVKILPPPRGNPDAERANLYIDQLESTRKERKKRLNKRHGKGASKREEADAVALDPNVVLKQAYRTFAVLVKRLSSNGRTRRAWLDKLVGLQMTELGIASAIQFEPSAIPEDFRAKRGRPTLVKEGEEKEAATA